MMTHWEKWPEECHYDPEQVSRLLSAKDKKITDNILAIERTIPMIFIQGSGVEPYETTLEDCTCIDFERRGLPCKHMYRLALETKQISIPKKTEIKFNAEEEIERYKQLYKNGEMSAKNYAEIGKLLLKMKKSKK